MRKFELVLLIHAHQPVGNFNEVFEHAYAKSYLPFIQLLARHPHIRIGVHYSGPLLEWIEHNHPEYFDQLRELSTRGQIEVFGGGFYEPILIAIPPKDRQTQITRLADYAQKHFGARPRGAWLAERVWEPQLPSTLSAAGVEYTLVDDNHFIGAGFEADELYGHYIAEDLGHIVRLLPGQKTLRYLIPFHEVDETIEYLRQASTLHPGGFATMGDDMEKFGIWPGTYELCYRDGWLERFFTALEENAEWLALSTPGEAISSHAPLGRADLPTASYNEMSEWSLSTAARVRYHELLREFSSREDILSFVRGGIWRAFFSKYREANLLHKTMLHVSQKVGKLSPTRKKKEREQAETLLLQGQCNDSYWHGVFGGLYSPHLRTAAWQALAAAETTADRLSHRTRQFADAITLDFDGDGADEVYLTSDQYAALISPQDGGTITAIDFRPRNVTLINSLQRRPEAYHEKLRNPPASQSQGVQSIHEQMRTKEDGLDRWLNYDRWPRTAFRLLLFGREKTFEDYAAVRLNEDATLAGRAYRPTEVSPKRVALASLECGNWSAEKSFSFEPIAGGFAITCDMGVRRIAPGAAWVNIGIEVVINFLAPSTPDRYFESDGKRFPLRWAATVPHTELRVVDEWQKAAVALKAPGAREFWIAPIDTVSESEEGFERVYQGSQVMAIWPVELPASGEWRGRLSFTVTQLD
ncbi:MAG TPA: alpha-amylase/4-alpha-glucanotransferase domain-containing protein [Candidatus Dormibacteraeota bacterium]|nr:alpha-amylase/4-alpha-glucanotransferase domain-containing protein [Candidatus Dormibacteraeota bacterium]